ncbi:MAG: LytTR family DNA-binding domain-containing protein [Niabella sp.]
MTKILIIDDEAAASNMLKLLIEKHVAGEKQVQVCNNPTTAVAVITGFQPHLIMLDIEMPHLNGFDLLNQLGSWDFDVIFTTAYDQYAIKAIRFSALDYLLKPIDIVDLQNAVYRHIALRENKAAPKEVLVNNLMSNLQQKDSAAFKLALNTMEGYYFFPPREIIRCEGNDNYTRFYLVNGEALLVSRTLKDFEEILTDYDFVRAHKSHLVNMSYVTRFDKEGLIWLTNGISIPVSRRKKAQIVRYFETTR